MAVWLVSKMSLVSKMLGQCPGCVRDVWLVSGMSNLNLDILDMDDNSRGVRGRRRCASTLQTVVALELEFRPQALTASASLDHALATQCSVAASLEPLPPVHSSASGHWALPVQKSPLYAPRGPRNVKSIHFVS